MSLPKPYWQDDHGVLYHGDCLEIMPLLADKSVDLVLTDPPYGIGEAAGKNKSRSCIAISRDYGNDSWDDKPMTMQQQNECIRLSKNQIFFGGNFFDLPPSSCWIVWDKDNGETDFADCELAWTSFETTVRKFKWRWQGMLQERMGKDKDERVHPTQKPIALMKWIINKYSKETDVILDPFAGSGTTLRAAKDLGRKYIGIEISEKYCEIAAKRLGQEVLF